MMRIATVWGLTTAPVAGVQHMDFNISNFIFDDEDRMSEKCLPEGQVFFSHLMKDGGESVTEYFACTCKKKKCSLLHSEGPVHALSGHLPCKKPTFCSSHGQVSERERDCGAAFKSAKLFTVIRDPVSRIFSLYNYYKYTKKTEYFQTTSLVKILKDVKSCQEDPTCSASKSSIQWSNSMVDYYFAFSNPQVLSFRDPTQSLGEMSNSLQATTGDLDRAKKMLDRFDAIFFMSSYSDFPELWAKSGMPMSTPEPNCDFAVVGASSCSDCKITDEEVSLIKDLNKMDCALYNYSRNLPNVVRKED